MEAQRWAYVARNHRWMRCDEFQEELLYKESPSDEYGHSPISLAGRHAHPGPSHPLRTAAVTARDTHSQDQVAVSRIVNGCCSHRTSDASNSDRCVRDSAPRSG